MADSSAGTFNVFLSWSKDRSRAVATALYDWLPSVVQRCRPWMSDKDIFTGQRWRNEIAQQLATIKIGIVCVTPENVTEPWLNFEAGALSKTVNDEKRVCCYCFGVRPAEVEDPLGDFNGCEADPAGTWELVRSINAALEGPTVSEQALRAVFDAMWERLDHRLKAVPSAPPGSPPGRNHNDMIEETLLRVRRMERSFLESQNSDTLRAHRILNRARLWEAAAALANPTSEEGAVDIAKKIVDEVALEAGLQKLRKLDET